MKTVPCVARADSFTEAGADAASFGFSKAVVPAGACVFGVKPYVELGNAKDDGFGR